MILTPRDMLLFLLVFGLILATGFFQSWNVALGILNMGLISAIMALGVNMQWGYAGLFNAGVMGFVALGGLATVIVSMPPVGAAWVAGGGRLILALLLGAATIAGGIALWKRLAPGRNRTLAMVGFLVGGFFLYRFVFDPADAATARSAPTASPPPPAAPQPTTPSHKHPPPSPPIATTHVPPPTQHRPHTPHPE